MNNNNGNVNRNNNNKQNGFSVRCLGDLMETSPLQQVTGFILKYMQLDLFSTAQNYDFTEDLFQAYFDCRKNKRNTINALLFEKNLEHNLFRLHDEISNGRYEPNRSIAFIVTKPVKREIFAADFRDRVVHHFIINKLNPFFEKEFICDCYACRVGKGTHFGIKRVNEFIHGCSKNYSTGCYVLKLDVLGFFMHINRNLLFERLRKFILEKYQQPDKAMIVELCRIIIFNDPTKNCHIKGNIEDWKGLPDFIALKIVAFPLVI